MTPSEERAVIADAEREAQHILDRADDIVSRANATARHQLEAAKEQALAAAERLRQVHALTDALLDESLSAGQMPSIVMPAAAKPSLAPSPSTPNGAKPSNGAGAKAAANGRPTTPSAGARLLAVQMAVSGGTRPEIEWRLREEFGVQRAADVATSIFGDAA
jgi:hypothetical protein